MLSTGMSPIEEIDAAVARVRARKVDVGVFQCTTAYPCPPEKDRIEPDSVLSRAVRLLGGLSDHSATIYPGLAGAALGMDMLEVHVTLSREMFGPDVIASVTTQELRQLVDGIRFIERMRAHPLATTPRHKKRRRCASCSRAVWSRAPTCRPAPSSRGSTSRSRNRAPASSRSGWKRSSAAVSRGL